jgi:hypothetical protein
VAGVAADVRKELASKARSELQKGGSAVMAAAAPWIARNALAIGKVSLVGLAGIAAYKVTEKLQKLRFKTYADLRYDLANQYRHARQNVGRLLTAPEAASYAAWYKQKLAEIDQAERSGRSITGISNLIFGD